MFCFNRLSNCCFGCFYCLLVLLPLFIYFLNIFLFYCIVVVHRIVIAKGSIAKVNSEGGKGQPLKANASRDGVSDIVLIFFIYISW